jgi:GNAT superfamily N-acetyltransferase
MTDIVLRTMRREDWAEVADLIYVSINYWYSSHGMGAKFKAGPGSTQLFCKVYEDLDPGCCFVAESTKTGRLAGSCFYHPRETHVSLGIMNVHPVYFGLGVARKLVQAIIDVAESQNKPLRLVSSAMNLDSFSLYTRAGFVPRITYQDMLISAPEQGIQCDNASAPRVRHATPADLDGIIAIEQELGGIRRERDHRYFLKNQDGIWHTSVIESPSGAIDGYLTSITSPASAMLGPGIARTEDDTAALIASALNAHPGRTYVTIIPMHCANLVKTLYGWEARNCETHVHQARGEWVAPTGIMLPTFMPETA